MQLIEVQVAEIVDGLAGDGEEQAGCAQPRTVAIGTGALHHDFFKPLFHACAGFAALAVTAIVPLDAARNAAETDLFAFPIVAYDLRFGRHGELQFLLDAIEDEVAHALRQLLPRACRARNPGSSQGCTSRGHPTCPGCTCTLP